jgi:hypothetical protein
MSFGENLPSRIVAVQTIALGAASVASSALNSRTKSVLLVSDTGAYIKIAGTPVATATTGYVGIDNAIRFDINNSHKIAALQANTGGTLFIYELDY